MSTSTHQYRDEVGNAVGHVEVLVEDIEATIAKIIAKRNEARQFCIEASTPSLYQYDNAKTLTHEQRIAAGIDAPIYDLASQPERMAL